MTGVQTCALPILHTKCEKNIEQIIAIFEHEYSGSLFTHLSHKAVNLKQVVNTNKCLVSVEKHGDYILITSVIDNLLKGAAGQAVENMNLLFSLPQDSGLRLKPSAF